MGELAIGALAIDMTIFRFAKFALLKAFRSGLIQKYPVAGRRMPLMVWKSAKK